LVKIHSTALNPVDWKIQKYGIIVTHYPAVLGTDASGTIESVGEKVQIFSAGDNVFFQGLFSNDKATFQQYAVVPAEITAKVPTNISLDQAASIPVAIAAAAAGLYQDRPKGGPEQLTPPWDEGGKGKYSGRPIVVFGGSSSVGQYVIQLAKLSGFSPIIATSSTHSFPLLKSLGATHTIDRNADVIQEVKAITGDTPVEFIYDAVAAGGTQEVAWDLLAPGGQAIFVQSTTVDKDKYKDKHIVNVFANVQLEGLRSFGTKLYKFLPEALQDESIQPNRVEILLNGLHGIPDGLKRLENNKVSGVKLIARPLETA